MAWLINANCIITPSSQVAGVVGRAWLINANCIITPSSQVAGVVGRAELLCAVFYILCILSYRRSLRSQGNVWVGEWTQAIFLTSVINLACIQAHIFITGLLFDSLNTVEPFLWPPLKKGQL